MERRAQRYAVTGIAVQIMLLGGCDKAPAGVTANQTASAAPAPITEVARPAGPERLILAFGDSLYAGYGLARGQSLPDAIQARLRRDGVNATIVNAGVSGDTTAAGRQRLTFALDHLKRKPDLVMLGLGGNDVLRQIPPVETRANMTAMMAELDKRGIPVVLTGMKAPPNLGPDYTQSFDAIWPDLAKRYDAALYPFILDGVIGNAQLIQDDHVHPTATGVQRIADRLLPTVEGALAKADDQK